MDPRMYPLATYLAEVRQDWPLHAVQTALASLDHLPYEQVAVGAVRAALDPGITSPRGIQRIASEGPHKPTPTPAPLCRECRRPHDPARPNEHVLPIEPEAVRRGATLAREALRAARPQPAPEKAPTP